MRGRFPEKKRMTKCSLWNIYRDSFWDVWQNRFDKFRDREWARKGECADCKMWRFCLGGGMHLHDDQEHLMYCHYKRLQ